MKTSWHDTRVLISGVCGTIGRELLSQLVDCGASEVVGFDHNENALFFLIKEFEKYPNVKLVLGDVRDRYEVQKLMDGIDVVLHVAAFKHVQLCETSPRDAVHTNITGTQNIIDAAIHAKVERVLFTSTDKAVNPTNVMGTTKLMAERLVTAAQTQSKEQNTRFFSTRFGNVLGSAGSVIPLFKQQILKEQRVTLTHPEMSRFIMSLEQAVKLVMDSVFMACGGEVFVMKMPSVNIVDLADVIVHEIAARHVIDTADIVIETIGVKPGEKMYEELLNEEEVRRTIELKDYYVIQPAFMEIYGSVDYEYSDVVSYNVDTPYNSRLQQKMTKADLSIFLKQHALLN